MPPRRRLSKPAPPPLDLDEIERDPGFRGMLSFLQPSSETKPGAAQDTVSGQTAPVEPPPAHEPAVLSSQGDTPTSQQPVGFSSPAQHPADQMAETNPPMGLQPPFFPYINVEGRGKRPLHYCRTVQDGHTSGEQIAYQLLWAYARRFGQNENEGSYLVDASLARICELLRSDHKNVKRLLHSLEEKLAIEVVQPADCKLGIPTRYRVYSHGQILDRRRRAGLVWVVRTRTTRFIDLGTVQRLLDESSMGQEPMGDLPEAELPRGSWPHRPVGR